MQIKASKVAGRIIFGEIKGQVFRLFLYFCNKIFKNKRTRFQGDVVL